MKLRNKMQGASNKVTFLNPITLFLLLPYPSPAIKSKNRCSAHE